MVHLIWSLILTLLVLLGLVIVPIWCDRPWEHQGATPEWGDILHGLAQRQRAEGSWS